MKISINNQVKTKISLFFLKTITKQAGKTLKLKDDSQISCALVNGSTIKKLNNQYRGVNQITDVLAFPTGQAKFITDQSASAYLGEIVICFPRAKQQAKQQHHSIKQELTILLIHGILHLLGYRHETRAERLRMNRLMEKIIGKNSKFKITNSK